MENKKAKNLISAWMLCMQDGDSAKVRDGEIIIYDSCGCEIAREYYK